MLEFSAAVWDATRRVNGGGDLARMNGIGEDRRTNEDWAHSVCVLANGWSSLTVRRELGVRS